MAPPGSAPAAARHSDRSGASRRRSSWPAIAFLAPSLVVFALFVFIPMGRSVVLSTQGSDIIGRPSGFVGGAHYVALFTDPAFGRVLLTTLLFALFTVVPTLAIGLVLALLLTTTRLRFVGFFRTAFAMPFAFSVATASVTFALMYNPVSGVLNGLGRLVGLPRIEWLTGSPLVALLSLAAATVWMNLGYYMLVLCAGAGSIDPSVVEAARLDGASGPRLARRIMVPLLGPSIFFLVVTGTLQALQSFGQIHILTRGGPAGGTTTLVYSIYRLAFSDNNAKFGYASAQAVVLALIVMLIALVQFGIGRKKVFYQ